MTPETKTYKVNELFYSIQGEGHRVGTSMIFLRFAECNLACGFCDTEFASFRQLTAEQIVTELKALASEPWKSARIIPYQEGVLLDGHPWVLLTGGEPGLQADGPLVKAIRDAQFRIAIETNGMFSLPDGIDWICCSPKTAEHTLKLTCAHELKYVRGHGQAIPRPVIEAEHHFVSPLFSPDGDETRRNIDWCSAMVKANAGWRLSLQTHKFIGIR
jgi:7-carboxy-7-deazaguanine synthase